MHGATNWLVACEELTPRHIQTCHGWVGDWVNVTKTSDSKQEPHDGMLEVDKDKWPGHDEARDPTPNLQP